MQKHLGLQFEGRLHSGIDDCRKNSSLLSNYITILFLIFFFDYLNFLQEHFVCDEEPCGQGSQAVQQWNDQEVKANLSVCKLRLNKVKLN